MTIPIALRDPPPWQKVALFTLWPLWLPLGVIGVGIVAWSEAASGWGRH